MSEMETSELPFSKKNITHGDSLEKCSFLLNVREWICSFESMHSSKKSKHTARWLWDLLIHGIIPEECPTVTIEDETILKNIFLGNSSITGAYLEDFYRYQKGQNDCKDRINMLRREISDNPIDFDAIDEKLEEFSPKLLNQLMTELGSAMNRASVHQ
jgi:hypothetical protein